MQIKFAFYKAAEIYKKLGYEFRSKILIDYAQKFKISNRNIIISPDNKKNIGKTDKNNTLDNEDIPKNRDSIENNITVENNTTIDNAGIIDINFSNQISKINFDTPILLVHGDEDNVVPMEMTKMAKKNLNNLGYFVNTYFSKGLGHGISLDGLAESTKFLKKLNI